MTLPNIQEYIYQRLKDEITALKTGQSALNIARERSEVSGGLANLTLAQLPLVNNTGGDHYFATDGLKPGESVGHGTGTPVFWDATTAQWLRYGDYTPPAGGSNPLSLALGGTGAALNGAGGASYYVKLGLGATAMNVGPIVDADLPVGLAGHTITGGSINNTPIGATTPNTGVFSTLEATGTLGVGIAPSANAGIELAQTLTGSVFEYGIFAQPTFDSSINASNGYSVFSHPQTAAAAFTAANIFGLYVQNATKGVGSAINGLYGLYIETLTSGANNIAIQTNGGVHFFQDVVNLGNTQQTVFSLTGKNTKYNNDTTAGNGLADIIAHVGLTGQTGAILATNFSPSFTPPVDGEYIITIVLEVTTVGSSGTISAAVTYNDDNGANQVTVSSAAVSSLGAALITATVHARTTTALQYKTTFNSIVGNPVYSLFINVLRLS